MWALSVLSNLATVIGRYTTPDPSNSAQGKLRPGLMGLVLIARAHVAFAQIPTVPS